MTDASRSHVLEHFLPRNVLAEVRQLARSFERDELFRLYVLKQMWLVIPAGAVFVAISLACAAGALMVFGSIVMTLFNRPSTWWPLVLVLIALPVLLFWFGSICSQFYALFSWLELCALRDQPIKPADQTVDMSFAAPPRRATSVLWLVGIFVVAPLIVLAATIRSSLSVLALSAAVLIFALILNGLFDRR